MLEERPNSVPSIFKSMIVCDPHFMPAFCVSFATSNLIGRFVMEHWVQCSIPQNIVMFVDAIRPRAEA